LAGTTSGAHRAEANVSSDGVHAHAPDGGGGAAAGQHGSSRLAQRDGRRWRVRMRCSSGLPLAAVLHEENAVLHPSPICTLCDANTNETQQHVMSECTRYADARADLSAAVIASAVRGGSDGQSAPRRWHDASHHERTVMLLQADSPPAMVMAVHAYLHRLFKTRAAVMRTRAEAAAAAAAATAGGGEPARAARTAATRRRKRATATATVAAAALARAREIVPAARAGGGASGGGVGVDHDRDRMVAIAAATAGADHEDSTRPARTAPAAGQQWTGMGAGGMRAAAASEERARGREGGWQRERARE
jgi:pyruvate/2-oxoglutarate dehydrogenase complex dihydrolipoamide acyltransferase (E2) component